jgi:DNA-binding NtrC family response regulator
MAQEQPEVVIIVYYLLRGHIGAEAVDAIHRFLAETQVIMITALADLANTATAMDFGVIAVIKNPLSINIIGRSIEKICNTSNKTHRIINLKKGFENRFLCPVSDNETS